MLNDLAANLKRLIGSIRPAMGDPKFDVFLFVWGAWLFSPTVLRALWWRIVFWAGTIAFAFYIAFGPGSV